MSKYIVPIFYPKSLCTLLKCLASFCFLVNLEFSDNNLQKFVDSYSSLNSLVLLLKFPQEKLIQVTRISSVTSIKILE